MATLANQVGDHPVIFTLLNRFERQREELGAPQAASDQHGDHGMVTPCAWSRGVPRSEKPSTLFRRQPVAEADADAVDPFHAADARGQFRAEETSIGGLVRDPADGRETQVDRGGCVLALLKVNAVAQDHRAVEREAGLRAVPSDELPDGVIVSALPAGGCKAVEHRSLGVLEIGQSEDTFGRLLAASFGLWHRATASFNRRRQPHQILVPAALIVTNAQFEPSRKVRSA
jgi:hypothetical protein